MNLWHKDPNLSAIKRQSKNGKKKVKIVFIFLKKKTIKRGEFVVGVGLYERFNRKISRA